MSRYPSPLLNLINQLSKLPGIGGKSAQRLAFHLMSVDENQAMELATAIEKARKNLKYCTCCGNLTDMDPCAICSDPTRDKTTICVVESPKDVMAIERMKDFKGLYHVLHGVISPMDGVGPEEINIKSLIRRLQKESQVKELILATNPNIEGEATAMYIARLVKPSGIATSRIANGLPVGGDLEYTDEVTLLKAMEGRRQI